MAETARGTDELPAPPGGVAELFGPRWALACDYVARLATVAVDRGLVGPRERVRLWDRHVLNCAAVAPLIESGATVADLGSGAGLPGIVLALLRPDLELELIEPLERRATFLQETVAELGLPGITVLRARAEDLSGRRSYDVVTARAVAPLERLLGWALPLTRPGGQLLALKGAGAADELAGADRALMRLRAAHAELVQVGVPEVPGAEQTWVVRVTAGLPVRPANAARRQRVRR